MPSTPQRPATAAAAVETLRDRNPTRFGPSFGPLLEKSARRTRHGVLGFEGDDSSSVLVVLSGWLSLSKALEDGNSHVIDFALPGDIVQPAAGNGITSELTIDVLEEGFVSVIPSGQWDKVLYADQDLLHLARLDASAARSRIAERMLRLGKGSAEMRLAYALLELYLRLGGGADGPFTFHVPLTQQQIGNFIGLSSVHVSRTTRRLKRKDVLEMTDHLTFELKDIDALCEIAGIDMETLRQEILLPRDG